MREEQKRSQPETSKNALEVKESDSPSRRGWDEILPPYPTFHYRPPDNVLSNMIMQAANKQS